jgi:subtilisin family serine protease
MGDMMKKYFPSIILLVLLLSLFGLAISAVKASSDPASKITPELQAQLESLGPGQMITVIITLKDQVASRPAGLENLAGQPQALVEALQAQARISQQGISALLEAGRGQGIVQQVTPFWVFNGFSVTGTAGMVQQLAVREEVQSITPDAIDVIPAGTVNLAAASGNIAAINAPALWDLGYYGQGVVVASMDTGVDINHPELAVRWRGGSDSWYDPYNQHPLTPTDLNGHGTWTTGVMVAADASGASLGVAPQAQWIAVKIFNDSGSATATAIHLSYQWLLDPDGNPATADAPQVVNNSWTFASRLQPGFSMTCRR